MENSPKTASGRQGSGRIALIAFWSVVVLVAAAGIGTLQYLGPPKPVQPPKPPPMAVAPQVPAPIQHSAALPAPIKPAAALAPVLPAVSALGTGSNLPIGSPIPVPNPDLLGPAISNSGLLVPRISANGLAPMRAYAATVPQAAGPHVAILVAGLGDDDAQSQEAVTMLPAAISFGLTP